MNWKDVLNCFIDLLDKFDSRQPGRYYAYYLRGISQEDIPEVAALLREAMEKEADKVLERSFSAIPSQKISQGRYNIHHERNTTDYPECTETIETFQDVAPLGMIGIVLKISEKPDFNPKTDWINITTPGQAAAPVEGSQAQRPEAAARDNLRGGKEGAN